MRDARSCAGSLQGRGQPPRSLVSVKRKPELPLDNEVRVLKQVWVP
jgi:hypothetical protein